MNKSNELKKLYDSIELDTTEDRLLLSKLKNGVVSTKEIDELIDTLKAYANGAKILDEIKNFEKTLVADITIQLVALEAMEVEYIAVAHNEDKSEQDLRYADMKKRYKEHVSKAEDLIGAIKVAYFQINELKQYEDRLYKAKEPLSFLV